MTSSCGIQFRGKQLSSGPAGGEAWYVTVPHCPMVLWPYRGASFDPQGDGQVSASNLQDWSAFGDDADVGYALNGYPFGRVVPVRRVDISPQPVHDVGKPIRRLIKGEAVPGVDELLEISATSAQRA